MPNVREPKTGKDYRPIKNKLSIRGTPKPLPVPKPPVFTAALEAVAPHLNGNSIALLSKSRITALAKKIALKESDLSALVAAHKLAAKTNLPADALFALSKDGVQPDVTSLASTDIRQLRKKIEVAVKKNIVGANTLKSFDAARPEFTRLELHEMPLGTLVKNYGLKVTDSVLRRLDTNGIKTLADIRSSGGLSQVKGLNLNPNNPAARMLDAHASLSILGTDVPTNAALISRGFDNVYAIGRLPKNSFISSVKGRVSEEKSGQIHETARLQSRYLDNVLTELRMRDAFINDKRELPVNLTALVPQICGCKACQDATSPLAYLADLLDYTVRHVRNNGKSISLTFLQGRRFHQPFRDLPASCEQFDKKVRQARIAIEVLRKHLSAPYASSTPQSYLEAVYKKLLEGINTSYDELRDAARSLNPSAKDELAERLMLSSGSLIDQLYRDPNAVVGDPKAISEKWLNQTFGLRDTTIEPLDPDVIKPAIVKWRENYLRQQWIEQDYSPDQRPLGEYPAIDPDLVDLADLVVPAPSRRKTHVDLLENRTTLITNIIKELKAAVPGPRSQLKSQLTKLFTDLQISMTFGGGATGMEGVRYPDYLQLRKDQRLGQSISDRLGSVINPTTRKKQPFTEEEFGGIAHVVELAESGSPILGSEWDDFFAIIVQRIKRFGFFESWIDEEKKIEILIPVAGLFKGITVSPDYFRIRPVALGDYQFVWKPKKWRSNESVRRKWENTLQARIEQREAITDALNTAVDGTEEAYLTKLLNELLQNAALPDLLSPEKLKFFTDHYQIDFEAGACHVTTRVAQAIETIQGVLFGIRAGLLDDNELTLDAPDFDEEWKWLGSYATWRAAMLVFLYPENVLRPTLRRTMSPASAQLIENLREAAPVSIDDVKQEVRKFEDYFADVCSLTRSGIYVAEKPFAQNGSNVFAIAQGGHSGTLYFSTWKELSGWGLSGSPDQSFWKAIGGLDGPAEIFGIVPYQDALAKAHVGVYARTRGQASDKYWFADFDGTNCSGGELPLAPPLVVTAAQYGGVIPALQEFSEKGGKGWSLRSGDVIVPLGSDIVLWSIQAEQNGSRRLGLARAQDGGLGLLSDVFIDAGWRFPDPDRPVALAGGILVVNSTGSRIAMLGSVNGQLLVRGATSKVTGLNGTWAVNLGSSSRPTMFVGANIEGTGRRLVLFQYSGDPLELSASTDIIVLDVSSDLFTFRFQQKLINKQDPVTVFTAGRGAPGDDTNAIVHIEDHWRPAAAVREASGHEDIVVITNHVNEAERGMHGDPTKSEVWVGVLSYKPNQPQPHFDSSFPDPGYPWQIEGWEWQEDQQFVRARATEDGSENLIVTSPSSDVIGVMTISHGNWGIAWNGSQSPGVGTAGWSHKGGDRILSLDIDGDGNQELFVLSKANDTVGILAGKADLSLYARWTGQHVVSPSAKSPNGWSPTTQARYIVTDVDQDGYDEIITLTVSDSGIVQLTVLRGIPGPIPRNLNQGIPQTYGPTDVPLQSLRAEFTDSRRDQIRDAYMANRLFDGQGKPVPGLGGEPYSYIPQNIAYLDEAYFFVPMEIGLRLRESGDYASALDWFRSVYNYQAPLNDRKISYRLIIDEGLPDFSRVENWLSDPLNPHAIAQTRKGSYSKFTLLVIVQCLLDLADADFTRATSESLHRALELYLRALDLLDSQDVLQHFDRCLDLIGNLKISIGSDEERLVYHEIQQLLGEISTRSVLTATIQKVEAAFKSKKRLLGKYNEAVKVIQSAQSLESRPTLGNVLEVADDYRSAASKFVLSKSGFTDGLQTLQFRNGTELDDEDIDNVKRRSERGQLTPRRDVKDSWEYGYYSKDVIPAPAPLFCIPLNPAIQTMRSHAELCLRKIRSCRNIAGLELRVQPYAETSAALAVSSDFRSVDRLPSLAAQSFRPLPYRYVTLVERTKQLVELARQMESSMMSFISSAEQAKYQEIKARQDLALNQAGVRLKDLQLAQATDGIASADLQRDRAALQVSHYSELISQGLSTWETLALGTQATSAALNYVTAIIHIVASEGGSFLTGQSESDIAGAMSSTSQAAQMQASFDRREQDWRFQKLIAQQDVQIGLQQIGLAQDQVWVATQERSIAALQLDHAEVIVDFLTTKQFANQDLYEWMSGVVEQVYRFFLQQATQLATLAELQLAFERQEAPAGLIKADYWERPSEDMTPDVGASVTGTNNVRGLTGSARLLRDIYELDQYAFTKNQRKLQLSETISLAQQDPVGFQVFRQTGLLPFETPMELFNRKFPGHYLRLIKRVRTSVIALIPPSMGIRATLSTTGTSRVVIGGDSFTSVTVQRGPESIGITSPINATGLFELDAQPELLVPFEGIGVDAHWVFEMPKPANQFDYETMADVLFTIEYTALNSYDYRERILGQLDSRISADRGFSFRNNFADAWYDLNNPDQASPPPMTVSFETKRDDFPPNLVAPVTISHVQMFFVQKKGKAKKVQVKTFTFTPDNGAQIPPNPVENKMQVDSSDEGVISTRRGAWNQLVDAPNVAGQWELSLEDTPAMRNRFAQEEIQDIIFVITYSGRLTNWPG